MWRTGLPACCEACPAWRGVAGCALLAEPHPENRRRLLTMPCDVPRLLARRFRGRDEDVAGDAVVRWLDPSWDAAEIVRSYGRAPRDARLWLTSWPYLYLGRTSVRRAQREYAARVGIDESPPLAASGQDKVDLPARVLRALDDVRRVDVVSYAMLVDLLRDAFDARAWGRLLSASAGSVTDRKYLAMWRYLVFFHDALRGVEPRESAVALRARRLSASDPDDGRALDAARDELGQPGLTMAAWRQLYRAGALRSIEVLGGTDAAGGEALAQLGTAFRRVLKVD
ncbi:MAG: hypothetical protein WKG00_41790 [Polyangiaceae bacterium]